MLVFKLKYRLERVDKIDIKHIFLTDLGQSCDDIKTTAYGQDSGVTKKSSLVQGNHRQAKTP
ncbi:hypothetical protein PCC7418_3062 [Halothece sp. PCC 7418]|nr:hypothetical protein PCC7418_3062 [Halothece sp. PCC 7418]